MALAGSGLGGMIEQAPHQFFRDSGSDADRGEGASGGVERARDNRQILMVER